MNDLLPIRRSQPTYVRKPLNLTEIRTLPKISPESTCPFGQVLSGVYINRLMETCEPTYRLKNQYNESWIKKGML